GEQRHRMLEHGRARVLGAELAADEAAVDRLAEDGGLPQRERLEPAERLDLASAPLAVPGDELGARREARLRRHRRAAERRGTTVRLAVGGEEVADVGPRI